MPQTKQVVLLMTDTQRRDMLGCYGNRAMRTPNLDSLARQGVRFQRAYTCQPVCGPARSSVFTGLYPHSNGVWGNGMPLGDNVRSIGQRVRDGGFPAAYIGKWHLDGGDYFGLGRCPDGWDPDWWFDMRNYLDGMSESMRRPSRRPGSCPVPAGFTFAHQCSDRAVRFLERHRGRDFLLVVSYDEPHHPWLCPEPYASMYADYQFPKSPNVWDTLRDKPAHQQIWAGESLGEDKNALTIRAPLYFGCNSFVDAEIGRVLQAVRQYAPGAMVIYTADHGDMLASHSLEGKGPCMYEEITGIPLIVRCPGVAPAGAVSEQVVSHIGIAPTILEAFDLPLPKILQGESLFPCLCRKECTGGTAFLEFGRYEIDHDGFGGFQLIRAIVEGPYKLAVNLLTTDELYDLDADPAEMHNLIDDPAMRTVRSRLHDRILRWMNDTRDPFRGYYWERRPWRADARPATWDYDGMTRQRENEAHEPRQLDYDTGLPLEKAVRPK